MEKPWKAVVVPWSQWGGTHTCGFVWAVVIKNQLFLPSNPQYELASPCLGTHAQKPWLWGCSRMENKVGSHKNRGAHSWRLRSSCFPLRSSRTKFRLGLNGAPQVEIWPPVFVNPGVNAALDLPIIFTVMIIPHLFHGFPEADGFSSCLWSQHKSLSCAGGWGFPVPLWHLNKAGWAHPEPQIYHHIGRRNCWIFDHQLYERRAEKDLEQLGLKVFISHLYVLGADIYWEILDGTFASLLKQSDSFSFLILGRANFRAKQLQHFMYFKLIFLCQRY